MTQLNGGGGGGPLGPAPPMFPVSPSHAPGGGLIGSGQPGSGGGGGMIGGGGYERGVPSEERRRQLRESESRSPPLLSNFFPIERYYAAADKVLAAYNKSIAAGNLDAAYVYGLRFSMFATKALPTHDYYNSSRPEHASLRKKNRADLERAIADLEKVVDAMDVDEIKRRKREEEERKEREELERLRRKALELQRAREEAERERRDAERELHRRQNLENSVAAKLAMLDRMPPRTSSAGSIPPESYSDMESLSKLFNSQYGTEGTGDKVSKDAGSGGLPISYDLPPPVLPPPLNPGAPEVPPSAPPPGDTLSPGNLPPPPSYSELPPSYSDLMNKKPEGVEAGRRQPQPISDDAAPPPYAAAAGGAKIGNSADSGSACSLSSSISTPFVPPPDWEARPPSSALKPTKPKKPEAALVPIRTLRRTCATEYDALRRRKAVEVFFLSTHQGRSRQPGRDSTNGCTVISPLVVARHLRSEGAGIADVTIEDVIDRDAPPILRSIRSKLGLPGAALIIPSDVHDHLVDLKILKQDEFVGVCGGNVLDPEHLGELLDLLRDGYDYKHLKDLKDENGNKRKLPKQKKKVAAAFFFHEHVMSIIKVSPSNGNAWYDIVDSLPHRESRNGSRTRCKDRASLEATLRWYASAKFGESDCSYIDKNRWDENMCDFDPRVFQAFVWAAD